MDTIYFFDHDTTHDANYIKTVQRTIDGLLNIIDSEIELATFKMTPQEYKHVHNFPNTNQQDLSLAQRRYTDLCMHQEILCRFLSVILNTEYNPS